MPCTDLVDEQPLEYRKSVFTPGVPVFAVEMLAAWGWERYSHVQHGMTTFGMRKCPLVAYFAIPFGQKVPFRLMRKLWPSGRRSRRVCLCHSLFSDLAISVAGGAYRYSTMWFGIVTETCLAKGEFLANQY